MSDELSEASNRSFAIFCLTLDFVVIREALPQSKWGDSNFPVHRLFAPPSLNTVESSYFAQFVAQTFTFALQNAVDISTNFRIAKWRRNVREL